MEISQEKRHSEENVTSMLSDTKTTQDSEAVMSNTFEQAATHDGAMGFCNFVNLV